MHIDGLCKNDAAHWFRLRHGTRDRNYAWYFVYPALFWKLRSNRDKNPQFRLKDSRGSRLGSSRSASCSTAFSRGPSSLPEQGWRNRCPLSVGQNNFHICEAKISAVVCLGGGHRTMYKKQLYALEVLFRKRCPRQLPNFHQTPTGPLNGINFSITGRIGPEPSHKQVEWKTFMRRVFRTRMIQKTPAHSRGDQILAKIFPAPEMSGFISGRCCRSMDIYGIHMVVLVELASPNLQTIVWPALWRSNVFFFCPTPFFSDKVSESCFTGQLPGMGTDFILASLQMCKVQRQSPFTRGCHQAKFGFGESQVINVRPSFPCCGCPPNARMIHQSSGNKTT